MAGYVAELLLPAWLCRWGVMHRERLPLVMWRVPLMSWWHVAVIIWDLQVYVQSCPQPHDLSGQYISDYWWWRSLMVVTLKWRMRTQYCLLIYGLLCCNGPEHYIIRLFGVADPQKLLWWLSTIGKCLAVNWFNRGAAYIEIYSHRQSITDWLLPKHYPQSGYRFCLCAK